MSKGFQFWTDCMGMPGGDRAGELVNAIRTHDADREITYSTFAKHADLAPLRRDDHPAMYRISAPDNWSISFHRSELPSGTPVYYFAWSGIEHFFVDDDVDVERELAFLDQEEAIPGGLASGLSPIDFDPEQLERGIEVELEHTDSRAVAREIAMDHLAERADYYQVLDEVGLNPSAPIDPEAALARFVSRHSLGELEQADVDNLLVAIDYQEELGEPTGAMREALKWTHAEPYFQAPEGAVIWVLHNAARPWLNLAPDGEEARRREAVAVLMGHVHGQPRSQLMLLTDSRVYRGPYDGHRLFPGTIGGMRSGVLPFVGRSLGKPLVENPAPERRFKHHGEPAMTKEAYEDLIATGRRPCEPEPPEMTEDERAALEELKRRLMR